MSEDSKASEPKRTRKRGLEDSTRLDERQTYFFKPEDQTAFMKQKLKETER